MKEQAKDSGLSANLKIWGTPDHRRTTIPAVGRDLLRDIRYGDEVWDIQALRRWAEHAPVGLSALQSGRIADTVVSFFGSVGVGVFDGPITAGDAALIAAVMEMSQPTQMIEFGVASGFSSAFVLTYAKQMGLFDQAPFLISVDLCDVHSSGGIVGDYVRVNHADLEPYWSLTTNVTSADLLRQTHSLPMRQSPALMALVDAGHAHPWPYLDLLYLWKALPRNSWVVMQDVRMMERWIADCVIYDVPSPAPIRGVDFAVSHWPGTKIMGHGISYNCAALRLDVTVDQLSLWLESVRFYPDEGVFPHHDLLTI